MAMTISDLAQQRAEQEYAQAAGQLHASRCKAGLLRQRGGDGDRGRNHKNAAPLLHLDPSSWACNKRKQRVHLFVDCKGT